jgi:Ni/Co efflux regulator RcnB
MKPAELILASAMVIGAIGAHAQDSTNVTTPPEVPQQEQTVPQDQTQQEPSDFRKDMVVIPSSEVPASLRSTLQGEQYKGWERGTIYRNQNSDMFIVEMRNGDNTRMYRFDQNGKPIKDY